MKFRILLALQLILVCLLTTSCAARVMEGFGLNLEFNKDQKDQISFVADVGSYLEGKGLRKLGRDGYDDINDKHTTDVYGDVLRVVVSVGVGRGSNVPIRVSYAKEDFFDDAVKVRDEIIDLADKKYPDTIIDHL